MYYLINQLIIMFNFILKENYYQMSNLLKCSYNKKNQLIVLNIII